MKRLFHIAAGLCLGIAALLSASCSQSLGDGSLAGDTDVLFEMSLPEMGTRAIADGMKVNEVLCNVYIGDKLIDDPSVSKTVPMTGGKAQYSTRLVAGHSYRFVFWADVSGNSAYTLDAQNAAVTVSYASAAANDENRDAFFACVEMTVKESDAARNIILKRPFAQLNFGLSDADSDLAGNVGTEYTLSSVSVQSVYTRLNLFDGTVSGETSVEFTPAAFPAEKLRVNLKDATTGVPTVLELEYLSMNYLLVNEKEVAQVELRLYEDAASVPLTMSVPQVPLKRNVRTNIYGSLISEATDFNIEVKPDFEEDDYNMELN